MARRWQQIRRGAVTHATVLGFLLSYGEPKIGEPLSKACERVTNSEGWKLYRETMPPHFKFLEIQDRFTPYYRGDVVEIGEVLRHIFVSRLPGRNEKDKLSAIFKSAPPWIIWFAFADYSAAVLDLELPDISSFRRFARSRAGFDIWWGLPSWAFERNPWPKDCDSEIAHTDLSLLRPEPTNDRSLRRRERKLARVASVNSTDEWPSLYPLQWLQLQRMDYRAAMAYAGDPRFVPDKRHPEFCGEMEPASRWREHGISWDSSKSWPLAKDLIG